MEMEFIFQQVTAEHQKVYQNIDQASLRHFIETVKGHSRIFIAGVGREGLTAKALAMRLMHMGKEIHWIWDETTPGITTGDLLIAVLGDGQIGHLDYICRRARVAGAFIYLVTGSPSGRTAQEVADAVFFLPAAVYRGRDEVVQSFQPMGNLFEQALWITFDVAVMAIVNETEGLTFEKMSARHRNVE